jgi:hypothetical protein
MINPDRWKGLPLSFEAVPSSLSDAPTCRETPFPADTVEKRLGWLFGVFTDPYEELERSLWECRRL